MSYDILDNLVPEGPLEWPMAWTPAIQVNARERVTTDGRQQTVVTAKGKVFSSPGRDVRDLLPAVPKGFQRVDITTTNDSWNRMILWSVVDEEIMPETGDDLPVVGAAPPSDNREPQVPDMPMIGDCGKCGAVIHKGDRYALRFGYAGVGDDGMTAVAEDDQWTCGECLGPEPEPSANAKFLSLDRRPALLEQYKPATSVEPTIVGKPCKTITAWGTMTHLEIARLDPSVSLRVLLPAVPSGFKRVLIETKNDPGDQTVAWKVVDEEISGEEAAPPMLFGTYEPSNLDQMAKAIASLKAMMRDNMVAFPLATMSTADVSASQNDTAEWSIEAIRELWDKTDPAPESEEWSERHEPNSPDADDGLTWRQRKPLF